MDNIEKILRARLSTSGGEWSMRNTSIIVGVKAQTSPSFATADEAFREALDLVRSLVSGTGYRLTNRADFGVGTETLIDDDSKWAAMVDVCLAREEQLASDAEYYPIETP